MTSFLLNLLYTIQRQMEEAPDHEPGMAAQRKARCLNFTGRGHPQSPGAAKEYPNQLFRRHEAEGDYCYWHWQPIPGFDCRFILIIVPS